MKKLLLAIGLGFASLRAAAQKSEQVFSIVEQMPQFPGGEQALYQYLKEHIQYPDSALKAGLQATVVVRFIVNENGAILKPSLANATFKIFETEALRLVQAMPNWIPGKQNGKAVPVYMQLPILFSQQQDKFKEQIQRIFTVVEQMPEFPGGNEALKKYFSDQKMNIGFVPKNTATDLTFCVSETGEVKDLKIITKLSARKKKKIMLAFKKMPQWKPGKRNGVPVKAVFNLSVQFKKHKS
jgi:TonB family protein